MRLALAIFIWLVSVGSALAWQPSMSANQWWLLFSRGVPPHPTQEVQGFSFYIPKYTGSLPCSGPCHSVNYLVTPTLGPLSGAIKVTGHIRFFGSPVIHWQTESWNTGTSPPAAHLMFQRRGDNYEASYGRWWSNPGEILIQQGKFSLKVSLKPQYWSSVFGEFGDASAAATKGFKRALHNPEHVGMTFGGGSFFGHGLNVSGGKVKITVSSYNIVPQTSVAVRKHN